MRGRGRTRLEAAIAELAERQYGKVTRAQLLALGLGVKAIEYRVANGWLRPDYPAVYSLGHRPRSREATWMAAVLYGGGRAVLSHWSAATLWRMRNGTGPRTHVTTPSKRRSRRTVTFHCAPLADDEVTMENNIPVTTPARTLLDLAPSLPSPVLARMVAAAPTRGAHLAALLERYPHRRGAAKLAAALGPMPFTRSDLEATVLDAIRRTRPPRPQVNVVIEGYEVDFVWPGHRVIAELDTYVTHGSRSAFERDRERDRKLAIAGWQVIRITDESGIEDLRRLLDATAARAPLRRASAA